MQQWTDDQRKDLQNARKLAKSLYKDVIEMAELERDEDGICPYDKFIMGLIFDQAVENIDSKLTQS